MAVLQLFHGDGAETPVTVQPGTLLADALEGQPDAPHQFCGGKGTCGKCRLVAQGALSPPTAEEKSLLTPQELAAGTRLACLTRVEGDCLVRLSGHLRLENIRVAGHMPDFPRKPLFARYGAAVDIGTTTLAAQLYGPNGLLGSVSAHNPQRSFGADVISRIEKALQGQGPRLAALVQDALAQMLISLEQQAGLPPQSIDALVITGNTAMLYLLTGQNPDALSHAPFQADRLFGQFLPAESLGLPLKPGAQAYLPRCVSAFVGADITTALLCAQLCSQPKKSAFLVDIGTNGEMALWHQGRLLCCSTAAGPTFEGAGITMGMPGAAGAIDHVDTHSLKAHVIGDTAPRGICGSGIVDAAAAMLHHGLVDENGLMEEDFVLLDSVRILQKDIRMIQLAKSAVCAGIRTLLDTAGVDHSQIADFSIAGGFGSYLNLANAAAIGLYPAEFTPIARVLGNAALSGSAMLLLNRDLLAQSYALAEKAETIDLTTSPVFMDYYVDGMAFE